ncbi:MAG: hypothetical protein A4S09_07155 [Proteobacteria bacterium SG_bin7]|nr:MAG: hypothetical protein A4S09_07155 [Proteobacteria bacterium SG_bin7]
MAFLLAPLSGCSTFATLSASSEPEKFWCSPEYTIPRIYSGVANDYRFLRVSQDKVIPTVDLFFSAMADTLVLPYTIYTQSRYGNLCPGNGQPQHPLILPKSE